MKKNLRQRLAMLLLAFTLIPQAAWATMSGTGTKDDPFLVYYPEDLTTFAEKTNSGRWKGTCVYIKLFRDIDMANVDFQPIGNDKYPLEVNFDGDYHAIKNLNINYSSDNQGFFGVVEFATIKNFTISGTMTSSTSGLTNIGSVVGKAKKGVNINDVQSSVNIIINGVAQKHIGGIVGHIEGGLVYPEAGPYACTYSGVINAGTSTDCIGGIVGFVHAESNAEISNCYSIGSLYSSGSGPTMGGILGYNNNEQTRFSGVHHCFSRAGLHYTGSNAHVGGIVGRLRNNAKTTVTNFCLTDSCGGKAYNTDGPSIPASNLTCTLTECKSGYITYTLNPESFFARWQQKIGHDDYPVLWFNNNYTDNHLVYKVQDLKCDQTTPYGDPRYSNSTTVVYYHTGSWVDEVKPTCTTAGNIEHYHCTLCNKNYYSQTGTNSITNVTLAALGHSLSDAWAWNDNGQSTKLTVTCKRTGCTHKKEATATYPSGGITRKQTTAPSCFAKGVNTYTATLTVDSKSYTSSKDVQDIAMIAHTLKGTWAWDDNGQSAKLTVTCTATGCTHKKESTATYPNGGITRKQKSAPTCTKMGVNTYTAALTVDGNKYTQTKDVQDIPLSGHNFAGGECATCHEHEYLTFTATGSVTLGIENKNGNAPSVEYTLDDGATWTTWDYTAINLTDGQKVRLRGSNPTGFSNPGNDETTSIYNIPYSIFTTSGSGTLAASGYLMSLIDVHSATTAIPSRACFYRLFKENKNLTTPPMLSATTLTADCYSDMFYSCSKLTSAPALPATTLTESCYNSMFQYCRALNEAPALPATTLAVNCYNAMFSGCSNLTQAPELPATTLAKSCYDWMFDGCTSLTQAPELPATTLAESCYAAMFSGCSNLTQAPELPATTLAYNCYNGMFMNCTSLSEAPALPATTLTQYCYASMFSGCSNLSQVPAMPATTLAEYCYNQMFRDCSNLTQAPALPATTLVDGCYNSMFMNCSSLSEVPALPATTLATNCYFDMFNGCTSLTQAPALPATTLVYGCYKQMFYNCASLNRIEVAFTDWSNSYTGDWLKGVASEGEFICPTALETIVGSSFIPEGWTVKHNDEPQFATGDVNGDGTVDIADINSIISIVLENETNASFGNRGDVNGDSLVDIADINSCISIILAK